MVDDNAVLIASQWWQSQDIAHVYTTGIVAQINSLEFLEKDCTPWELLILFGNRLTDKKKTAGLCKDYVIVFINSFLYKIKIYS